jgi:NAD(P)-dependent dehydrogenase (short-subunit alcohol dehydrogenase family)
MPQTWLIVGASRGIGLEFVTQLLGHGHTVIATARGPPPPNRGVRTGHLWPLVDTPNGKNLTILECDVSDETSIKAFAERLRGLTTTGGVLERGLVDCVVLNAGVLEYPNRVSEMYVYCVFVLALTHLFSLSPLLQRNDMSSVAILFVTYVP